ncbi:MAG: hypothetical protein OXO51_19310 [Gemmatimonadota bacterium]|nr:hypothetical protein [Gemmatimonadota bacterium]
MATYGLVSQTLALMIKEPEITRPTSPDGKVDLERDRRISGSVLERIEHPACSNRIFTALRTFLIGRIVIGVNEL